MPRQPKLRSSCDGCGAAKLRCDRAQPECGRCLSLDQICVYGVSRKTGKPPRDRLRCPKAPDTSRTLNEHGHAISQDRNRSSDGCSSGTGRYTYDGRVRDSRKMLSVHPVIPARDALESQRNNFRTSVDALDSTHGDLFDPLLPDFTSLDFSDGLFSSIETGAMSSIATPELESYSTSSTTRNIDSQAQVNGNVYLDSVLLPSMSSKDHDCFREAYDILYSLTSQNLSNDLSMSESPPATSSSIASSTVSQVPLDHVLSLNRQSSERLEHLLTCSCSAFPQLTVLFTSIISQILTWYHKAAGCTQSNSLGPAMLKQDTASRHASVTRFSTSSRSGTTCGFSTWSSMAACTLSAGNATSTRPLCQFTGLDVIPGKMAVGNYDVDDLRVQSALIVQLLSGEIARVGRLIDHFTAHRSSQSLSNEGTLDGVSSLHHSLGSWLRSEHSRIASMMKSRLKELNN